MTIPKRNDELALFATIQMIQATFPVEMDRSPDTGCARRDLMICGISIATGLGMQPERADDVFENWRRMGWWKESSSIPHAGILTARAPLTVEEVAGHPVVLNGNQQDFIRNMATALARVPKGDELQSKRKHAEAITFELA